MCASTAFSKLRAWAGRWRWAAAGLVVATSGPRVAAAWRLFGTLPLATRGRFYVGKFCYDCADRTEKAGRFSFTVSGEYHPLPASGDRLGMTGLYLAVYDDEQDRWKTTTSLYGASNDGSSVSCEDLLQYQNYFVEIPHDADGFNKTVYITESIRPRFWYFTFIACDIEVVTPIQYALHAQNILQGIQSEFGLDERGALPLQLFATLCFGGLAFALRNLTQRSTGAEALRSRPLLRLLFFSSLMSTAGASCLLLHYAVYMVDGLGWQFFQMAGQLSICISKALLNLLQLLVAKGWALFYSPEEVARRRVMFCVLGAIIALSVGCEINAEWFHDASTTIYLYESLPGTVILILNLILFVESFRSMLDTYRHETSEEVRIFYFMVSSVLFAYFLTLPSICVLAVAFDPWVRAKYVARAEVTSRFFSTAVLAYCLRPTRLDAMINARLEDGLEPIGEMPDDGVDSDGVERMRDDQEVEAQEALLAKGSTDDFADEPAE